MLNDYILKFLRLSEDFLISLGNKKNNIDMKFQNANCRLYETNNLEVCKECSTCDEGTNDDILIIEIKRGIQVL